MLAILLKYKLKTIYNTFTKNKKSRRYLIALIFGVWILVILIGKASDFFSIFKDIPDGEMIAMKFLNTWLMGILIFIFFTGLSNAISNLFESSNLPLLLSMPVKRQSIFTLKLIDGIFVNSYIYFFVGIPIFIAYGIAFGSNAVFYIVLLIVSAAFLLIPTSLSLLISMVMVKILPAKRAKDIINSINGIIFLIIWLGMNFIRTSIYNRNSPDFNPASFESLISLSKKAALKFLPTEVIGNTLLFTVKSEYLTAFFSFLPLLFAGAIIYWLSIRLAENSYYSGWSTYHETAGVKKKVKAVKIKTTNFPFIRQDLKYIIRDTRLLTQIVFQAIFAIVFPILILRGQQKVAAFGPSGIFSFQLMLVLFLAAMLISQNISRLIPMYGKSFWMIKLSPVPIKRFVYEKFILGYLNSVIFTIIVIIVYSLLMKIDKGFLPVLIFHGLILGVGITSLGLLFGSTMPRFDWDHPKRMLKTSGGIFLSISSAGYVFGYFISILALYEITGIDITNTQTGRIFEVLIPGLLTLILYRISLYFIKKHLTEMEWTF